MPWIALPNVVLMFLFIMIGLNHFEGCRYLSSSTPSVAPTLHSARDALYRAMLCAVYNDKQEVAWVKPRVSTSLSLQLGLCWVTSGLGNCKSRKPETLVR